MYCTFGKSLTRQKKFVKAPPLEELVCNLIQKPEARIEKQPRYKSVYSDSVKAFYELQKAPHKTMGYYKPEMPSPKKYLKKHTREVKAFESQKKKDSSEYGLCEHGEKVSKKIPVPRYTDRPLMVCSPTKNFIKENIRNVSRAAPKRPVPRWVDTKRGNTILLECSGLMPKFCNKKEFAQVPKYLVVRQEDMHYAKQKYEEFLRDEWEKEAPKKIGHEERQELIAGLKKNWAEANREYASLPVFTDTLRKKIIKEEIEQRMRDLEKDIELLERHEEIYVLKRK